MRLPYRRVRVEWLDTRGTSGWTAVGELKGPVLCVTEGRLVPTGRENCLTIAASWSFTDDGKVDEFSLVDEIPTGCVVMIHVEDSTG